MADPTAPMADRLTSDLASLRISRDDGPARGRALRWVASVAAVVVVAAAAWWLGWPALSARVFKTAVEITEVARVSPAQASVELTSTGYVTPQTVAKVGAKVQGRLARVHVREGEKVKAGQVLFELDAADQRVAVAAAQTRVAAAHARAQAARANLAEVRDKWDRERKLAERGAVPQAAVDELGARMRSLEEAVKAADAESRAAAADVDALAVGMKNLVIAAPIDGTATTKPAQVGDVVGPAAIAPLVEIVDFASLLVETDVPEGRLHLVRAGGPCEVALDAFPDRRMRCTVVEVSPRLNRAKATATVKVRIEGDAPGVLPDMAARVSFLSKPLDDRTLREPPKVIVPAAAVVERSGAKVVFAVEAGRARMLPVETGGPFGTGVELVSGPPPGTRLVKNPPPGLGDGAPVKESGGGGS